MEIKEELKKMINYSREKKHAEDSASWNQHRLLLFPL